MTPKCGVTRLAQNTFEVIWLGESNISGRFLSRVFYAPLRGRHFGSSPPDVSFSRPVRFLPSKLIRRRQKLLWRKKFLGQTEKSLPRRFLFWPEYFSVIFPVFTKKHLKRFLNATLFCMERSLKSIALAAMQMDYPYSLKGAFPSWSTSFPPYISGNSLFQCIFQQQSRFREKNSQRSSHIKV